MSNKMRIRRTQQPTRKPKEQKSPGAAKRRKELLGLIPAIIFIAIAIWYFISSAR